MCLPALQVQVRTGKDGILGRMARKYHGSVVCTLSANRKQNLCQELVHLDGFLDAKFCLKVLMICRLQKHCHYSEIAQSLEACSIQDFVLHLRLCCLSSSFSVGKDDLVDEDSNTTLRVITIAQ